MPVHVIAEAGTNHDGRVDRGQHLTQIAKDSGADSVKFQVIYPEGLYAETLFVRGEKRPNDVIEQRRRFVLPDDDFRELAAHAQSLGIDLSASVFDSRGLDLLDSVNPPYIKIASCDLNNTPFLREVAQRGRRMVISTGMATLGEVETAVEAVVSEGNSDLVLLHCVSVYPAPSERMNLPFMQTLARAFGFPVGFSDHSQTSVCAVLAVGLGAQWIEKHVTYDRGAEGFDHANAMEADTFAQYIADLRVAEQAMESHVTKVSAAEAEVAQRARRSLVTARDIAAGEVLSPEDVLIVRPSGPLVPGDLPKVVGRKTRRALSKNEPLEWTLLDV
ncbi:MAG: N-acetylneuraminate synthase family protein [Myxococcota bacterium]